MGLLLYFAIEVVQETSTGQPVVVVSVHVDGGVPLGGLVRARVREAAEQIIVLELGVEHKVRVLHRQIQERRKKKHLIGGSLRQSVIAKGRG